MKQVVKNSGIIALAALFVLGFSGVALANEGSKTTSSIELRFIGHLAKQPVFQLSLANKEADEFYITITDADGNLLYSDKVKGTNITRKFAINTEEVGDNVIRVEIRSKSTNKKEVYNINRTFNYVVESSVTRVN